MRLSVAMELSMDSMQAVELWRKPLKFDTPIDGIAQSVSLLESVLTPDGPVYSTTCSVQ